MESPKELFISYSREPRVSAFVARLKEDLQKNGFTVWLDLQDIPSGSDWHGAIGGGLYQCRAILPVITNRYLHSTYCIKELYTADGDRKDIFPLIFEDVDLDQDQNSQGVKFTISSINWTMCRPEKDDYNTSVSRLIRDLRAKGLGDPNYQGPERSVQASSETIQVGLANTTEPVLMIPDAEMVGGITTAPSGEIIFSSGAKHCIHVYQEAEQVCTFGKCGILEDNDLMSPGGVAVTQEGELLVAGHYHLKRFTLDGRLLGTVGDFKQPEADLTLNGPMGLAVGKEGRIYIVETAKHRVKILNSDFTFHSSFTKGDKRLGPGHLNSPMSVAVNSQGKVFITDLANNDIQVFSPLGEFMFRFKKQGHGLGFIASPMAIAIDGQDLVYVGTGTGSVSIFEVQDQEVKFVMAFGSHGNELGQFNSIRCLHVDKQGRVYVGEVGSHRIQVFQ